VYENEDTQPKLPCGYRIARVPTTPRQTNTCGPANLSPLPKAGNLFLLCFSWMPQSVTRWSRGQPRYVISCRPEIAHLSGSPCRVHRSPCPGGKVGLMADTTIPETFEEIVEWAYSTLPQKIRDLPDFPGIQVVEEPPKDVFADISNREKWRRGTELLGLYSGVHRTEQRHDLLRLAPDLIFVFRGPILRCSKGDLRAEVKRVVWHEVAHWLGHDEEEVKGLGLSAGAEDGASPARK
jgi:predicted Zn-dependent protease with MMP-like domain